MKPFLKYCSVVFGSCFSAITLAQTPWNFEIAPYIWAMNMNGTVQNGPLRTHVKESFSDILKDLNFAGMVWLEARNDRLSLFGNAIYAALSKSTDFDAFVKANLKNNFGIFSAGAAYQIYAAHRFSIEPYVGLRYTLNDTTIRISTPFLTVQGSDNQRWTDPIVGARLKYLFTHAWSAMFSADVGGTNAADHYSYNLIALLGYKFQTHSPNTSLYLGYRMLDQHYSTGQGRKYFSWDMKLFGPIAGISFVF